MNRSRAGHFSTVFFLFLFFLLPQTGSCVTPWNWARTFGGPWTDIGASIQPTPDGGAIVAGTSLSFNDTGREDAWLLKLRSGGEVEWEKTLDGGLWDFLFAIRATPDGGYIAAGDLVPPPGVNQDAWIVKLSADGQIAWEKLYGREGFFDHALSIEPTADGGYIVVGWTQSEQIGEEPDGWVFKLTAEGEIEWQKLFGGDGLDTLFSVQQTSDGGYIVAGGSYSFSPAPRSDAWLVKLRPDGEVAWQKIYGGDGDEAAYSVRQARDGGYFLLALTTSFGLGVEDIWVLRLNRDGGILWQKAYGGPWSEIPAALQTTFDGGAIIAGSTASFGAGQEDGWILKLSSTGQIHWQRTYGGADSDIIRDIRATPLGYIATGSTSSFGAGNEDVWVVNVPLSGNLSWSPIDKPSSATARNTVSAPRALAPVARDTFVQPAPSQVEVIDTDSVQTNLAIPPFIGTTPLR